jgi:hypothetical protein
MDLAEFRRRLMALRLDDKKPASQARAEYIAALLDLEREELNALSRWRPPDGGEGDRSSLVRHPNAPKPVPNQSSIALSPPDADERLDVNAVESAFPRRVRKQQPL